MTRGIRLGALAAAIGASAVSIGCGAGHRATTAAGGRVVTGGRDGASAAQLDVVSGATSVTVDSASLGADLYRVSTPPHSGLRPSVTRDHDLLRVSLTGHGGPAALSIELSDAVVWRLGFDGGASDLVVGFATGRLSGVDLVAGNARAALSLPRPTGTVAIIEQGGVARLALRLAGATPVRLIMSGGAARVALDGVTHTGIGGGHVFTSPGFGAAHNRYEVHALGGVSSLTVDGSSG